MLALLVLMLVLLAGAGPDGADAGPVGADAGPVGTGRVSAGPVG